MEPREKKEEPQTTWVGKSRLGHHFEIEKDKYGKGESWKEGGQRHRIIRDPYTQQAKEVEGKGEVVRDPRTQRIVSIGGEKVYGDLEDL